MAQMYHHENQGTVHHGTNIVKCTVLSGVVHLYHENQLYHGIPWYNCTTQKTQVHFTIVLPW
jgi:hypothetical protein